MREDRRIEDVGRATACCRPRVSRPGVALSRTGRGMRLPCAAVKMLEVSHLEVRPWLARSFLNAVGQCWTGRTAWATPHARDINEDFS